MPGKRGRNAYIHADGVVCKSVSESQRRSKVLDKVTCPHCLRALAAKLAVPRKMGAKRAV